MFGNFFLTHAYQTLHDVDSIIWSWKLQANAKEKINENEHIIFKIYLQVENICDDE